jgi:hypothetical protein
MIVRAKTFRQWLEANLSKRQLKDLVRFGVDSGFPGLTYYEETSKLYDKFSGEIWEALQTDADGEGKSVMEFVADIRGAEQVTSSGQLKNLLAWYMTERTAVQLIE